MKIKKKNKKKNKNENLDLFTFCLLRQFVTPNLTKNPKKTQKTNKIKTNLNGNSSTTLF